ncbi:MAG: helix-turn-helix domain-containing protein, partial [Bacteroides sp.]
MYLQLPSKKVKDGTFNPRTKVHNCLLREEKLSQQAIANRIGRDKSVVSREIRRNADKRNGTY